MPTPTLQLYNGRYYAVWSDNRRSKRKSMGTANRADAEIKFAQWLLVGGHKDQPTQEARESLTVGQLWVVYEERHVEQESAAPDSIGYCWKNLDPHFSRLILSEITADKVDDYLSKRTKGEIGRPAKPATVRKELAALRACLNWCAHPKRRIIEPVDVPTFDLPPEGEPRDRWLTVAEIKKLLASARKLRQGDRMSRGERFLWLALETAARKQAILDLTWDRVDFEIGVIHYDVPGRKKTKKRRVSVPISQALRPVLERMEREREGDLVMDHKADVWATIQVIVERSGIVPPRAEPRAAGEKPKSTGVSPHTLRHTAATHMARRGVELYYIAGVLGNTLAMVERVYSHHCPGRLRDAVNSISSGTLEAAE